MRKLTLTLLAFLALALPLGAEVTGSTSTSITSTATQVTFASARTSVGFINNSGSANEVYIRLYWEGETVTAATTATAKIRLEPGESTSYSFNSRTEKGIGYIGFSVLCDTAETATLRYTAK